MSSYVVLARRYRPQTFEEVVGQQHVTGVLTSAIKLKRTAHAYLFAGPRGVGKTTIARVLAKALNCEKGPTDKPCGTCESCKEIASGTAVDMIEIDGASNNGIEQIRELREQVRFTPVKGRYKTYIIDEVHMLSTSAFNGLLKTLEEPPPYTVFILATTEAHKIPVTITSRCQRYQLKRLGTPVIVAQLQQVLKQEKIEAEPAALTLIANQAEGALRDALSLLDQVLSLGKKPLAVKDVVELLGVMPQEVTARLIQAALGGALEAALKDVDQLVDDGYDLHQLCKAWLTHVRYLMLARVCKEPKKFIPWQEDQIAGLVEQAKSCSVEALVQAMGILREAESQMRFATQPRIVLEAALARLSLVTSAAPSTAMPSAMSSAKAALPASKPFSPAPAMPSRAAEGVPAKVTPSAPMVNKPLSGPALASNPKLEIKNPKSGDPRAPVMGEAGQPAPTFQDLEDATEDNKANELWPAVLASVKAKSMSVFGYLTDSRVTGQDSGSMMVEVHSDFHKSSLEKNDNRLLVEGVVTEVFRKHYRVKWIARTAGQKPASNNPASAGMPSRPSIPSPAPRSAVPTPPSALATPNSNDPAVALGMKVFQGRVIPPGEKRR